MKRIAVGTIVSFALCFSTSRSAVGEVFLLGSGGRVVGRWLNPDEAPRQQYVIETPTGGRITLAKSQVKQVLDTRPEQLQYERIRPDYPDTVQGQWDLAEWCRLKRLSTQRKTHLKRVLELDGDHVRARHALGYTHLEGEWVRQEEIMTRRGYKRYQGSWRTPQEIELLEGRRKTDNAQKQWAEKLRRWRDWLGTDREPDGWANIRAIQDPLAVKALVGALENDPSAHACILYIEVLAGIGTPAAVKALAACSLEDPVEEVRLTCLDHLQKQPHPEVVAYFVGKLRDQNNRTVNLAAVGLGRLKAASAVGPLIDTLLTTHTTRIRHGSPGSMTTTFGTGPGGSGVPGGGGLSVGGGVRSFTQTVANQPVLDALVAITGENFNFDQRAWTYWLAAQREHPTLDARRDR